VSELNKPIRVLVVDDHRVVRAGVVAILGDHSGLEVVGEAGSMAEAILLVDRVSPDLVLMDLRLPDGSGVEACRRLKAKGVESKVVVLTSYVEPNLVFEALEAGVDGYVLKDSQDGALVAAMIAVVRGEQVLSPAVTQALVEWGGGAGRGSGGGIGLLSGRDLSMLKLVAEGLTYKEVADRLHLAEKTVRNAFSGMMSKVGVSSRSKLIVEYVRAMSDMA
jgi:two-component system response regulator DevR